jgi:hypothetical protein
MNTRVKELYAEAVMSVHDAFIDRMLIPSAVDLEFAELIVRECAKDFDNTYMSGGKTMGAYIREKFGVES